MYIKVSILLNKLWKNGEILKDMKGYIRYLHLDLEGNFIKEWDSAIAAGKTLRLSQGNISSCCLGKRNKCGNFKWKYKNEN